MWQNVNGRPMDPLIEFEHFFQQQTNKYHLSLREFSKRINLDASTVSKILDGKRSIPKSHAIKLSEYMFDEKHKQDDFVRAVIARKNDVKKEKLKKTSLKIKEENFEYFQVISQWEYFAILNLLKAKKLQINTQTISKKLGITLKRTQQCIETLLTLGFIEQKNDSYFRTVKSIQTTNEVWSRALQMAHAEELEMAKRKLHIDFQLKDFQSMTFAIPLEQLSKIKALTQKLYDAIDEISEKNLENAQEIYLFSSQLFPLSNVNVKTLTNEILQ